MTHVARVGELAALGTEAAFSELVGILRGSGDAETKEARAFFAHEVPPEQLFALLGASRASEGRPYTAESERPFDHRSRLVVETLLLLLGQKKHEPARAVLVELLRHPVHEVRLYAVHGLAAFDDDAAIEALFGELPRLTSTPRSVALRAILGHDARPSIRLGPLLADDAIAADLLYELFRDAYGSPSRGERNGWIDDPVFVRLAVVSLRASQDSQRRSMLRELLAKADRTLVEAAERELGPKKRRAGPGAGVEKRRGATSTSRAARTRLLAEAREQVMPLCEALPDVIEALRALGYRFVAEPLAPPPRGIAKELDAFEKEVGPLPASVRAFYERVGSVDLRGTHPAWPRTGTVLLGPEPHWETDPLVVLAFSVARTAADDRDVEEPFDLVLIPEPLTKAGFSAGPGYSVRCAEPMTLDAPLRGDPAGRTFVEHLRRAIAWTGLPGIERCEGVTPAILAAYRGSRE
ncbi:MAG: hypothetical protein K1X94_28425 [Sandaracinaceae bacterium]|nr:hypothetical protein [Sandaracinaceae bacterium]